jgi:hypothetical protein
MISNTEGGITRAPQKYLTGAPSVRGFTKLKSKYPEKTYTAIKRGSRDKEFCSFTNCGPSWIIGRASLDWSLGLLIRKIEAYHSEVVALSSSSKTPAGYIASRFLK